MRSAMVTPAAPTTTVRYVVTPATRSRNIIAGYILSNGPTDGIKTDSDLGLSTTMIGRGKAWMVTIVGGGTRAGNGANTTVITRTTMTET